MNLEERAKLNLTVLKRHDPHIIDVCDQSPHAVVYKFMTDKKSWVKMSLEGVLFLVHRRTPPEYALIILNRNNMENFCLYLSDIIDISLHDSFVICNTNKGDACGLWLFEEKDRKRFVKRIKKLREKTSTAAVDIMDLFKTSPIFTHPPNEPSAEQQPEHPAEKLDPSQLLKLLLISKRPNESSVTSDFHNQHDPSPGPALHGGIHPLPPPPLPTTAVAALAHPPRHPHYPQMEEVGPTNADFHSNPAIIQQQQQHPNAMIRPPHPQPPQPTAPEHDFVTTFIPPRYPASPQKTASLLQVLQGGAPPPRTTPPDARGSPQMMGQPPWPSQAMYPSPLGTALPLMPHQALELTQSELDRRLPVVEGRPILSKPEFIQQFLNMVQSDSSFLDSLYDQYRNKQIMAVGGPEARARAASSAPIKDNAPYYHQ